jgi:hypothetical protein
MDISYPIMVLSWFYHGSNKSSITANLYEKLALYEKLYKSINYFFLSLILASHILYMFLLGSIACHCVMDHRWDCNVCQTVELLKWVCGFFSQI